MERNIKNVDEFLKHLIYYIFQYENPFPPQNVSRIGSLIFNLLRQWQLIFNRSVHRKEKKLAVSRNETKILTVNRKRHYSIETFLTL